MYDVTILYQHSNAMKYLWVPFLLLKSIFSNKINCDTPKCMAFLPDSNIPPQNCDQGPVPDMEEHKEDLPNPLLMFQCQSAAKLSFCSIYRINVSVTFVSRPFILFLWSFSLIHKKCHAFFRRTCYNLLCKTKSKSYCCITLTL